MSNIPVLKSPSLPSLPPASSFTFNSSITPTGGGSLLSSIGASPPSVPNASSISGLSSKIPGADSLKQSIPNIPSPPSLPDIPNNPLNSDTKLTNNLPKFDSKMELPEIENGKLGLLSANTDLSQFKEKSLSSFSNIVPEFSPGQKISQLKSAADSKLSLLNGIKSVAGGAAGAALGAALAGGNLKNIAGAAIGSAAGGIVGGLASKAGVGGNVAGALGTAAGTLAAGGNVKQAVGGAVGNVVGSAVGNFVGGSGAGSKIGGVVGSVAGVTAAGGNIKTAALGAAGGLASGVIADKFGGGAISSAAGAIIGSKVSGGSNKSSLVGGLTAGAGALVSQKMFPSKSSPTIGASGNAPSSSPSNIDITTSTNSAPPAPEKVDVPPPSPIATIDSETGKVVLSNTQPSNVTTVKETVISGGSRTRYADRKDPVTGESIPVPDKVEPPTKTVTTTVIDKSTGEVVSSTSDTQTITKQQASTELARANASRPREVVQTKPAPIQVPRPVSELYDVITDSEGNESLRLKLTARSIIPDGLELVSMVGSKDSLVLTYEDGSVTTAYTPQYSKEKFGIGVRDEGVAIDTRPDGTTSKWSTITGDDLTLPEVGDRPYFVKNSDGSITYTFSDGNKATELPSLGKSLFTINGVSAEVEMPVPLKPTSTEMPQDQIDKEKVSRKEKFIQEKYTDVGYKLENGNYVIQKAKVLKDAQGQYKYRDYDTKEVVERSQRKPGRQYRLAVDWTGEIETISAQTVDEIFEKEWTNKILPDLKIKYAREISNKYAKLNGEDKTKAAESADKTYVIEVTRTGYRSTGDSYKVMMVRVYKKVEEVTNSAPAPAANPVAVATPPPAPTPYPGGLSKENFDKLKKYSRLAKKQMHLSIGGMYSSDPSNPTRARYDAAAKSLDKYTWIYPFEEKWSQDKIDAWAQGSDPYIW